MWVKDTSSSLCVVFSERIGFSLGQLGLAFLLIQLESRQHPTNPAYISSRLRGWLFVLNTSESIWRYPVFAFICCVSIHLENLCVGAICSRGTPKRRSQTRRFAWVRRLKLSAQCLPTPRVLHPWSLDRFAATHPRYEPHALVSARADPCGERSAMIVPTATPPTMEREPHGRVVGFSATWRGAGFTRLASGIAGPTRLNGDLACYQQPQRKVHL
jgi:hypothetical protein